MRIAICSSYLPFVKGGGTQFVDWLEEILRIAGHDVEKFMFPESYRSDLIMRNIVAYRCVAIDKADRIICIRPQSHFIQHPHKILWFIHHVRQFYDLWGSEYSGLHANLGNLHIKDELLRLDNAAFAESKKIFTNSQVVTDRLLAFNKVSSEVLYPPIWKPERFSCKGFNDEVVYLSRIEAHKRQHLLIEALQHTKTPVRIRFMGRSDTPYVESLSQLCESLKVSDRVSLDNRWVTEEEKEQVLSECLAVAYLPYDEDSYGYPSLEASHSRKPILTTTDSGGVLELVENRSNGLVSQPTPQALAECLDAFYTDREQTKRMGINAHERLSDLHISWPHVCSRLLS